MDCIRFEDRLEDFLLETMKAQEREAAERHIAGCSRCRQLVAVLRGETDLLPLEAKIDLTHSILQLTSGSACNHTRQKLCDLVDGHLTGEDGNLVYLHLEHCRSCSSLAQGLAELKNRLPAMAAIDPGQTFTAEVLRATLPAPEMQAPWTVRIQEAWHRFIQRPRFAFEASYIGTLLLVLLVGNPAVLFQEAPAHLLDLVRTGTRNTLESTSEVWPEGWNKRGNKALHATLENFSELARQPHAIKEAIGARLQEITRALRLTAELSTQAAKNYWELASETTRRAWNWLLKRNPFDPHRRAG